MMRFSGPLRALGRRRMLLAVVAVAVAGVAVAACSGLPGGRARLYGAAPSAPADRCGLSQ